MTPALDWLEAAKAAAEMMWDPDRPEEEDFAREAQWRAEWAATADEDRDIDDAHEFGQWVDDKFRKALAALRRAIAHEERMRADRRLPCGCIRCICKDPEQCHWCGADEATACQASRLSGGPRHAATDAGASPCEVKP